MTKFQEMLKATNRFEGNEGVKNLCRLARAQGYIDKQYFGQFENGSYGDLINYLEDNSGAIDAIVEFMIASEQVEFEEGEEDEEDEE